MAYMVDRPEDATGEDSLREELMPKLVGFSRIAALLEEQISEKIIAAFFPATKG
jgi:hypothetical protein